MIRPATPADSASVTSLGVAAGLFTREESAITDKMMTDYFTRNEIEGHACIIDEEEGQPVGVAYYEPAAATDGTWYLLMIAVHPDMQSQGRGQALMAHVEDALRGSGQRMLLVETAASLERTQAFYAKCGYEVVARISDYYAEGEGMVVYRKILN